MRGLHRADASRRGDAVNALGWIGLAGFGGALLTVAIIEVAVRGDLFPEPPPVDPPAPTPRPDDLATCDAIWPDADTEIAADMRAWCRRQHPSSRGDT